MLLTPDATIKVKSMKLVADLLESFGDYEEEGKVRREVLQVCLSNSRVRNPHSSRAMGDLGRCLKFRNRFNENERLLYSALQLRYEETFDPSLDSEHATLNINLSWSMLSLAKTRTSSGNLQEAGKLIEPPRERYQAANCQNLILEWDLTSALAAKMCSQCSWMVAEKTLCHLILRLGGTICPPKRIDGIYLLGKVLPAKGQYAEASLCFEEVLLSDERRLGLKRTETTWVARRLGECYTKQGLHQDALKDSLQRLDKLGLVPDDELVRPWIAEIEATIAQQSNNRAKAIVK